MAFVDQLLADLNSAPAPSQATGQPALSPFMSQMMADLPQVGSPPPQATTPVTAVQPAPSRSLGSNLLRQVGLTARYGMEGLGGIPQILGGAMQALGIDGAGRNMGGAAADAIGLPSPETGQERVVGDITRTMAGAGGMAGGASALSNLTTGGTKAALSALASNPASQVISGAGAGGAAGATREAGGGPGLQTAAAVAGGIVAPTVANILPRIPGAVASAARNTAEFVAPGSTTPPLSKAIPTIDPIIDAAIKPNGMTMADLPANVQQGIRTDVQKAMQMGGDLSPDALRRLADYRITGATPTQATITLDPALVSQQKNLAKLGINSKDQAAQQLGLLENANNKTLIGGLNDVGATAAPGTYGSGQGLLGSLQGFEANAKSNIGGLYDAARDSQGRAATLDPHTFANTANDLLDQNLAGGSVPPNVRTLMNDFASGKTPLNIDTAEQFKTVLASEQRAVQGTAKKSLSLIRQAIDETPIQQDTAGGMGQSAIDSFNAARSANRAFMGKIESTPSLSDAVDGVAPDSFFQNHVINSDARDLSSTLGIVGDQGKAAVKAQVASYLKGKALNGAADEVGNFSQSAYNKALTSIGDQKLQMLFTPAEVNQLKAIGRVASYEQVQPRGTAVNNANTAGTALAAMLDRVGNSPLLSKIPFGKVIADPAQNISVGMKANGAMNIPKGLLAPAGPRAPYAPPLGLLMSPAIFAQEQDQKKRGLLSLP